MPGESFPLKRGERASVTGFDVDGSEISFEATGWFARCMQHEYDHLNGFLYVDRLDDKWGKKASKTLKAQRLGQAGSHVDAGRRPRPVRPRRPGRARPLGHAAVAASGPLVVAVVGPDGDGQVGPRPRPRRARSAARSSTPTPCSSTAAWTSARPSCPSGSAAASRTTSSTSSTSPRRPASRPTRPAPGPTSPRSQARGHHAVLVGGSGLYVRAALDRLEIPPTDPGSGAGWRRRPLSLGAEALLQRLRDLDPAAAPSIEPEQRAPHRARPRGHRAHRSPVLGDDAEPRVRAAHRDHRPRAAPAPSSMRGSTRGCDRMWDAGPA